MVLLLCLSTTLLYTQEVLVWKGGTPGKETSWNEAGNWDKNVVPGEDTHVIIKSLNTGHYAQPEISGKVIVTSIELQSKSLLKINESGTLIIDGTYTYSQGILIFGGRLLNNGTLSFNNVDVAPREIIALQEMNHGHFFIDGRLLNEHYALQVNH